MSPEVVAVARERDAGRLWRLAVEVEVRADSAVMAYARVHDYLSRCPHVETVLVVRDPEEAPPGGEVWQGGGGRPPER